MSATPEKQELQLPQIRFHKTVRLAASGDVRLTKLETQIIDTPDFQRLRQIKQLGPSCWVYPTAVHTRFDHSIGVLNVVERIISAIRTSDMHVEQDPIQGIDKSIPITERQRVLARLYGLLHDVTHVPFGHTLEDELKIFASHDGFQENAEDTASVARFKTLLGEDSAIGTLIIETLGREMYTRFRNIYMRGKLDRLEVEEDGDSTADEFIYHLVSDTVCADLLDYLKRDSFFCDLALQVPDRVLNYMYIADIGEAENLRRRVVIRLWKERTARPRRDIMTDLSDLLNSRYKLAERVYFHHAKIIVGTMIGRAALEAKLAGFLDPTELLRFGDESLLNHLSNLQVPGRAKAEVKDSVRVAKELANAALERRLYKCVKRFPKEMFDSGMGDDDAHARLMESFQTAELRRRHENEIAQIADAQNGDVLIYVGPKEMNMKVAKAIVEWRGKKIAVSEMEDEPIIKARLQSIEASHRGLWSADLLVKRDLTEEQKKKIALAFKSRFLPRDNRIDAYTSLFPYVDGFDQEQNNRSREELRTARSRAAEDIVYGRFAAHDLGPKAFLREAVARQLSN